jgi:lipopolysaccharide/colanic/teichoic acid biosynthesis glycosyltransferase
VDLCSSGSGAPVRAAELFTMLKFQSMVPDAEDRKLELEPYKQANGGLFKMRDDRRVTPFRQIPA